MRLGLKGKVALVTASSRGLGFATAAQLALEGAHVVICGRNPERVEEAVARLRAEDAPGAVLGMQADVRQAGDVEDLVGETVQAFEGLDILVTNAGGPPGGKFDTLSGDQWREAVELTLLSAVRLIQTSLPHLRRSDAGSILTVTSISAKQPIAGLLLSNALRPAVLGLTKTLAQELAADGIRVNSILPGWTATERVGEILADRARANNTTVEDELRIVSAGIAMGRLARPEEFAKVAAFLVSPAASYITGAMIPVDGGSYTGLI